MKQFPYLSKELIIEGNKLLKKRAIKINGNKFKQDSKGNWYLPIKQL